MSDIEKGFKIISHPTPIMVTRKTIFIKNEQNVFNEDFKHYIGKFVNYVTIQSIHMK